MNSRHSHTDRESSERQRVADILAMHWWDEEIYSCSCGSQGKTSQWTYHVADLIQNL